VEAPEEVRARATLEEMQLRISQGPYAALGLTEAASPDDVRAAFLGLTKQFHPARFARMSPELHRLSNEVFIGIKTAHDALMKQLGAGRVSPQQSGAMPVISAEGTGRAPVQRVTGQSPVARPSPSPLARGTDRASQPVISRTTTPPTGAPATKAPSPQMPRVQTEPVRTSTGPNPRVQTDPLRTPTAQGARVPGAPTSQQPRTQTEPFRGGLPPRTNTPPLGTPIARPATPPTLRPATPPGTRPTTPTGTRPTTPPPPQAYNADTVRHAGVPKEPPFDERAAHREALILLNDQNWSQARQVLHNLAARVPQSKTYRALLGYARGREAQVAGRTDDAALEYQRALQLDPDLAMAKAALAEVQRRR
jgi:hypothetical protein